MASSSSSSEYPKTAVNKLGRLPKRGLLPPFPLPPSKILTNQPTGHYDYTTIHTLLDQSPILHVSFTDPAQPFPVVLPMLGCTGTYACPDSPRSSPQDIYIHGYMSGRLFRQSAPSSVTAATTDDDDDNKSPPPGLAITIAATLLDGLVLSLAPFHNSCNYRSAVVYGYAQLVTDEAEALWAMRRITDNMLPGRWQGSRAPPTGPEVTSTAVLRVWVCAVSFAPFLFSFFLSFLSSSC